jgi:hypothetical protein
MHLEQRLNVIGKEIYEDMMKGKITTAKDYKEILRSAVNKITFNFEDMYNIVRDYNQGEIVSVQGSTTIDDIVEQVAFKIVGEMLSKLIDEKFKMNFGCLTIDYLCNSEK